jgi:hypothetical protein
MAFTKYGERYFSGAFYGIVSEAEQLTVGNADTVAVGTGDQPIPTQELTPEANQLTEEVFRRSMPNQNIYHERVEAEPTVTRIGIDFPHGQLLPFGTPITERALIVTNPDGITDPDGVPLDEIIVAYHYGPAVPLGPEGGPPDEQGTLPSSTKIGIALDFRYLNATSA